MTHLPKHPFTGLTALGLRRDGRPIWPVLGGAPDEPPTTPPPPPAPGPPPPAPPANPPADPPKDGIPAGDKRAILDDLAKERAKRQALEQRFEALATALGGGDSGKGKSDVELLNERFAQHEKDLSAERAARFRSEIALDKKLTPGQAALLAGATREEIAAHADLLIAEFGGKGADPDSGRRGGMRPDPAQGSRPEVKLSGKEAGKAEAERRFGKKT